MKPPRVIVFFLIGALIATHPHTGHAEKVADRLEISKEKLHDESPEALPIPEPPVSGHGHSHGGHGHSHGQPAPTPEPAKAPEIASEVVISAENAPKLTENAPKLTENAPETIKNAPDAVKSPSPPPDMCPGGVERLAFSAEI